MECIVAALVIGGCTALGALAVRWRRRRARATTPQPPEVPPLSIADGAPSSDGRGLDGLFPGDVLLHDGMDLIVTGIARLTDGAQSWCECRLEDGERERWLIVPADDADCVVGQRLPPDELVGEPSNSLEHAGQIYTLSRYGRASVSLVGELAGGLTTGDDCRYWDYTRPGADRLWIRRTVGFAGQRVPRHLLTLLPGS